MKSQLGWFPLVLGRVYLSVWGLLLMAGASFASPSTSTAPNPTVTFATPGVRQVTLQVCNVAGCSTIVKDVVVLDPKPQIVSVSAPTLVGSPLFPVFFPQGTFQAQATGRPALAYEWTFTRGGVDTVLTGNPVDWIPSIAELGTYQGKLKVSNADGTALSNPFVVTVVKQTFVDVPPTSGLWGFVEAIAMAGITSGCGSFSYCPNTAITRGQMAVFLLLAKESSSYQPPACVEPQFADVPCTHPLARWINELAARGITGGCGGGKYCPDAPVTRDQMAVFLLATKEPAGYVPPACTTPAFGDVPCSSGLAPWVNELAVRGVTSGCGGGNYCPAAAVTRGQMAVFLSVTFSLPLP